MATFQAQVEGLTSLSIGTTPTVLELDQFLIDGVLDVTDRWLTIHPEDRELFMNETGLQVAQGADIGGAEIISVLRADGVAAGNFRPCRRISPAKQSQVTDTDSLSFASKYHPVYMVSGSNVKVFPIPTDNSGKDSYKVHYVNNTPKDSGGNSLTSSDSGLGYFPADKVYLVILYAGIKSLHAAMGATTISDLTITGVPPDTPAPPNFDTITVTLQTAGSLGTAPTYTSPTTNITGNLWTTAYPDQYSAIDTAWTAANAEIGECLTIADNIHTEIGLVNAAYDKFRTDNDDPALFGDESTYDTANSEMTRVKDALDKARTLMSDDASYNALSGVTDDVANTSVLYWLGQEDTEMVNATSSMIRTELQRAQVHLAEWNATVQSLNVEGRGFASTAQGYGLEIQSKLGIANTYMKEVVSRMSNVQPKIAEYSARVQDALSEFNEESALYQSTVKRALTELQVATTKAQKDADFAQQRQLQDYASRLQKYQGELGVYSAEVNAQVQEYGQNLQADGLGYQWLQDQYSRLKAEYDQAFMRTGAQPQRAGRQPQRAGR